MLDKAYKPNEVEDKIYQMWETGGFFTPKIDKTKKPFTILLPLPNANDPMHMGHALFTVEDIMVRYHRMLGEPTLWLPGGDHAGIETQFVFEKYLAKQDKSRFDYDRETLYQMIWDFCDKNKNLNRDQMKKLGFSLDWTRYHYSLEPEIVRRVLETFCKLYADGLIYRGERIVNFCTKCGTAFSDLEIDYVERKDPLYYLKYGPFVIATTRTEDFAGNVAVAYHPGDKRYENYLGKEVEIESVNGSFKVKVVADSEIDPKFGTGMEKVTPGHDALDYEIAQRHNLPIKKVIGTDGRMTELAGRFAGMKVNEARKAIFEAMNQKGLIDHVDENYIHSVATCYRCRSTIEPLTIPQWYVKTKPLAKPAIEAVKKGLTKIVPKKRFEKMYFDWLKNIKDWNISRQIVWGPQLPVWYCLDCNLQIELHFLDKKGEKIRGSYQGLKDKFSYAEIKSGLQSLAAPQNASYQLSSTNCEKCHNQNLLQETDTFDTWFLSGQWPVNTLKTKPGDLDYFYPTSVLDTLWDILFFWVGRMMMLGIYLTGKVPFEIIHLHSRVVDKKGQKMSKSKGNVIDPLTITEKYGADALRLALVLGVAPASDIALSEEKIIGMRNFCNKLWNIGRFIEMQNNQYYSTRHSGEERSDDSRIERKTDSGQARMTKENMKMIKKIQKQVAALVKNVTKYIDNYNFGRAAELLYQFTWHEFADNYLEYSKHSPSKATIKILNETFATLLKLLHPFIPFVTEELWQKLNYSKTALIIEKWPNT